MYLTPAKKNSSFTGDPNKFQKEYTILQIPNYLT